MPARSAEDKKKTAKSIVYWVFPLLTIAVIASESRSPAATGLADPTRPAAVLQGSLVASSMDRLADGLFQSLRTR